MMLTQNLSRWARRSRPVAGVRAVAMQRVIQIVLRMIAMATLACAMAACSSDLSLNGVTLVPKPETLLRKPDWTTFSGGKNEFELRPVTAADLVGAEGQCNSRGGEAAADPTAPGGGGSGGIPVQIAEGGGGRRAGPGEKNDNRSGGRGRRAGPLPFLRGLGRGVYRFGGGRRVSTGRAPGPPPAPAKPQKGTAKKPAGT